MRISTFGKVDHKKGYRGDDGYGKLVSPPNVENVVQESQHGRNKK